MSKIFRLALLGFLCGLFCMTQSVWAAKPDYVVSLSSVADIQKDVLAAVKKIDPQSGMMAEVFLAPGGPIVPPGLGTDSPIGVVGIIGETPDNAIFGPCDNFKMLKVWFDAKKNDGTFPEESTIVERGKSFVIARENTKIDLPEDPTELLGDLPSKYLFAVQCTNPAAFVDMLAGVAQGAPGAEADPEQIRKSLTDMESVLVGLNVVNGGDFQLSVVATAKDGSSTAADLAKTATMKSILNGFYSEQADAGIQLRLTLSDEMRTALKAQMALVEDEIAKAFVESIFMGDKIDMAGSFNEEDGKFEGVFACSLADGKAFLETLKKAIPEDSAEWNIAKIGKTISVHKVTLPTGEELAIATHPKFAFIAVDTEDSVAALKAAIQNTGKVPMRSENFTGHFNAEMLKLIPNHSIQMELDGELSSKSVIDGNTVTFTLLVENDLLRTGLAMYKASQASDDTDASDELDIEESEVDDEE